MPRKTKPTALADQALMATQIPPSMATSNSPT